MAFHHNPLFRMPAIATEARVVSMLCCMLVFFVVLLVCCPIYVIQRKAMKTTPAKGCSYGSFWSQARPLLSGVASSVNIIKSRVSQFMRHKELKIYLYLPCHHLFIHESLFLHLINRQSRKHEELKINFIYLSSLSESRDEIPVKLGSLSHSKISNFVLCIENTK